MSSVEAQHAQLLVQLAQRGLLDRLAGIDPAARQRPLPAMRAQARRALGEQERRLARRVGFDHDDGDGGALQPAGIGAAAQLEAAQAIGDGARARRRRSGKTSRRGGLVKVQTTAGGTLRQMRLPRAPSRCRRSRKARGMGGFGPVGELHQRRRRAAAPRRRRATMPFTTSVGSDSSGRLDTTAAIGAMP